MSKTKFKTILKNGRKALLVAGAFFVLVFPFFTGNTQNTQSAVLSAYTTYFNEKEADRKQNIIIASNLIDGVTVQPYGEFSFNQTVGERTQKAGFKQAKIIQNGEYVLGVGGGVCQVSTTLYNACVKSGLEILEFHPHSLRVSYVPPSRDAMVSTYSDLRFCNPHPFAVTLHATVFEGGIRVSFTGGKIAYRYEMSEKILVEIPPPPPIVKIGDEEKILRSPKNGVKSEGYLEIYHGEKLVEKRRIREDSYSPIQGIIVKKNKNTSSFLPSKACVS